MVAVRVILEYRQKTEYNGAYFSEIIETFLLNLSPFPQGRLEDLPAMTLPTSKLDLSGQDQADTTSSRISMTTSRANMTSSRSNLTSSSSRGSVGLNREAVKLYCDDNVFKYIQITEETTALELVYIGLDQVRPIIHITIMYYVHVK